MTLNVRRMYTKLGRRGKLGLAQVVSFFVVEPTHTGSNLRFDKSVALTTNYSFSGMRRLHRL
jgi:hypothetical protein